MTGMRPLLLALAASTFLATSQAAGQATGTVAGVVRDSASGRPLVGAVVTLTLGASARVERTGDDGSFAFGRLTAGDYELSVRRLGYGRWSQRVQVGTDAVEVAVTLARLAELDTIRVRAARQGIYGVVGTAKDLRPLPNADVIVIGSGKGTAPVDSNGSFFVPIRSPGSYVVRARAKGFVPQTVSVTVLPNDGVEVALLLDTAANAQSHRLEMAYGDFDDRRRAARNSSVLLPRTDLQRSGDNQLVFAIRASPEFIRKALRIGETACIYVDGRPRPGVPLNAYEPDQIEAIELYTASSDATGTLARGWPRSGVCSDTGMARMIPGPDVIRWIVIWLKQ